MFFLGFITGVSAVTVVWEGSVPSFLVLFVMGKVCFAPLLWR
jgi:hypothetical protein